MKSKSFTLMELMIAIAIMAIMAGIAISVYRGYVRKAARSALETDTRNCITCVAAVLAETALTGETPDFTNCTDRVSKYTQRPCQVNNLGNDEFSCRCNGANIITGDFCEAYTTNSSLNCSWY